MWGRETETVLEPWQGLGVYDYGAAKEHRGDSYWGCVRACTRKCAPCRDYLSRA